MDDSWFEDESDQDETNNEERGSETESVESETSDDDNEVDLDEVFSKVSLAESTSYSSRSGMSWSRIPSASVETNFVIDENNTVGPTDRTKDVTSMLIPFFIFCRKKYSTKFWLILTWN